MIVDHLNRIAVSLTVREAWDVHVDLLQSYGFDRLLYVATRFRGERGLGDLQDALFLTNHGPDYRHAMLDRGLIRHAAITHRREAGAQSWSAAPAPTGGLPMLAAEARVRCGLVAGCDVVLREVSSRAWGAIELCARPGLSQADVDALWREHGAEVELLCNLTHLKLSHLPSWGGRRPLTRQQRRVLHWVSEGKTAQDVGTIMGLTSATVEKHLRLARDALDVQTTAQAVCKAAQWNQLDPDEPLRLVG